MNNYVITTDNNADLPEEFYKEHQIGCTYFSYTLDGKEYTTVISYILIKAKGNTGKVYENFMCRKDKDGKWKILGWEQSTADAAAAVGVE